MHSSTLGNKKYEELTPQITSALKLYTVLYFIHPIPTLLIVLINNIRL